MTTCWRKVKYLLDCLPATYMLPTVFILPEDACMLFMTGTACQFSTHKPLAHPGVVLTIRCKLKIL